MSRLHIILRAVSMSQRRLAAAALLAGALMLPPVAAEIVWDKSVNVVPAPNFWYTPILSSDTRIQAFVEKQEVVMPSGRLEVQRLNRWDDIDGLDTREVGGARIDSHMVYFDKATQGRGRVTLSAEVEFSDPIVGFVADDRLFAVTNPLFAPNPTHKEAPAHARWSLEDRRTRPKNGIDESFEHSSRILSSVRSNTGSRSMRTSSMNMPTFEASPAQRQPLSLRLLCVRQFCHTWLNQSSLMQRLGSRTGCDARNSRPNTARVLMKCGPS